MNLKAATIAGVLSTVMPAASAQACQEPSGYPSAQEEWQAPAEPSGSGHHHTGHKHHHHHAEHQPGSHGSHQNPDFSKPHSNKVGPADFE